MGTKINLDYQVDDTQFDNKVNTKITTGASEASVVNTDIGGDTMAGVLTCPEISFGNAIAPGDTASIYGVQDGVNTELNIRFGNSAADKLQIEYYNGVAASVIVEMDGNLDVTYNVKDYLVNSSNDVTFDLATDLLVDADGSITLDSPSIVTVGALGHTGTAIFSSNTTVGGWLSITGTTRAAGTFYAGTDSPISGNRLNYDGYLYATRIYNSIYNDFADFQPMVSDGEKIYGECYYETGEGLQRCFTRCQKGVVGVASDTYGMAAGVRSDMKNMVPIAVAGWVLAFVDYEYKIGTPLVNGRDGWLTKARWYEKLLFPERTMGTFMGDETAKYWGVDNILVKSRSWVKVK